jgi:hypothetical protein
MKSTRLAKLTTSTPAVAIGLALTSQLGKLTEVTRDVPGLGGLAASLVVAVGLGLNSISWIHDDRAKRVAKALLSDPDISIDQYRAVWCPPVDREAVSRQLRAHLEAIDRATENDVADALLNALRYRTKHPEEKEFARSVVAFFRDAHVDELETTKILISAALLATPDDPLALFNNRTLSNQKTEPGVLVVVADGPDGSGHGKYVSPAKAVMVRRIFRRLKDADFARSTGMSVGNFTYDGPPPPPESDDDSLVIGRDIGQRLVALIP